jgi:hypothetical protein
MGKADKVSIEALFRLHQAVYPQSDMDEAELECYLAILISMVRGPLCWTHMATGVRVRHDARIFDTSDMGRSLK